MIFTLLSHSWLSFWRSKSLGRSLGTTIFTWIMIALMLLYAIGIGYMLDKLMLKVAPEEDIMPLLNGLLIFYWMLEFVFRFIIQKNITLNVQYYLTQRISRKSLAHFMLLKSWVNLFLLITVLVFWRFAFTRVGSDFGAQASWVWLLFILGVSFCLHHLVIFIHQISKGKVWIPLVLTIMIAATIYANVLGYIDLLFITKGLMNIVLSNLSMGIIPWLIAGVLYYLDYFFVRKNLALDNLPQEVKTASAGISNWVQYLNSKGVVGQLISIELRLIWRNKRPRGMMLTALMMLAYFILIFLRYDDLTRVFGIVNLVATGALMINYGQLLFSWESYHFDQLMIANFKVEDYIKSKVILLVGFNTILLAVSGIAMFALNSPFIRELPFWYLVNSGLFVYIFIWVGILSAKRIDANARAMFNYEGLNVMQFLIIIPYFGLPSLVKYLIDNNLGEGWGTYVLAGIGLLGLLMFNPIINSLSKLFLKKKYKIMVRLRE